MCLIAVILVVFGYQKTKHIIGLMAMLANTIKNCQAILITHINTLQKLLILKLDLQITPASEKKMISFKTREFHVDTWTKLHNVFANYFCHRPDGSYIRHETHYMLSLDNFHCDDISLKKFKMTNILYSDKNNNDHI